MNTAGRRFSLRRLEALTDGIYAIAMTILVLSLPLPQIKGPSNEDDIIQHFNIYAGLFKTYAMSFLLLGSFWVFQLRIFRHISQSSLEHIWVNLMGLLVVCLIPFTSSMLGYHSHTFSANLVFHLNIFLVSLCFLLQCAVLIRAPDLIAPGHDKTQVHRILRLNMVLPGVSLLGLAISIFDAPISPMVYLTVPVIINMLKLRYPGEASDMEAAEDERPDRA